MIVFNDLRIYNKRDDSIAVPADAVYVGRPSIFGNPFVIGKDGNRQDVVRKYRDFLLAPQNEELLISAKRFLRGKSLVCWCAPDDCHAEVLMWFANR